MMEQFATKDPTQVAESRIESAQLVLTTELVVEVIERARAARRRIRIAMSP
jgi:hypothetical protein